MGGREGEGTLILSSGRKKKTNGVLPGKSKDSLVVVRGRGGKFEEGDRKGEVSVTCLERVTPRDSAGV